MQEANGPKQLCCFLMCSIVFLEPENLGQKVFERQVLLVLQRKV